MLINEKEKREKELKLMMDWINSAVEPKEKTILYTDIVNSTSTAWRATKYNGDNKSLANVGYMAFHHLVLANVLLKCNGELGDKSGDGVVCFFESAEDAIAAAFLFLFGLRNYTALLSRLTRMKIEEIKVRIGVHQGPYFCLPLGWEREIIVNKTPQNRSKRCSLDIQDEIIGGHIYAAQRLESSVKNEHRVFISEKVVDDLKIEWPSGKSGEVGGIQIGNNLYVVELMKNIKLKGIDDPPPPKVYRIEERSLFIREFFYAYFSTKGNNFEGCKKELNEKGLTLTEEEEKIIQGGI